MHHHHHSNPWDMQPPTPVPSDPVRDAFFTLAVGKMIHDGLTSGRADAEPELPPAPPPKPISPDELFDVVPFVKIIAVIAGISFLVWAIRL